MPSSSVLIISKSTIYAEKHESNNNNNTLRLSVSDLPILPCQYIQKGVLLTQSPYESSSLISHLKISLSKTLTHFPPLTGRLNTNSDGHVEIICNNAGVDFVHASAPHLTLSTLVPSNSSHDVPLFFRNFFQFDNTLNYAGHYKPLTAIQVTELNDGVFIGISMNHAVVDGTSFWNFFNTFAEFSRGETKITRPPCFNRKTVFDSPVVLKFPEGGPSPTCAGDQPLREKIFHFSRENILKLKFRANNKVVVNGQNGKTNGKTTPVNDEPGLESGSALKKPAAEISSFQSLNAQLWRSVTRARKLDESKTTFFGLAVNCRNRVEPPMEPLYFGNAIQTIYIAASVKELLDNDLGWSASLLHQNVVAHNDAAVRKRIKDWESNPGLFPSFDGAGVIMASSPRFPGYDNDFGWGRPVAIRSGMANKFDGKISAYPGREGNGAVDLELVLAPEIMAGLEEDMEFMQYVS